MNRSTVREQLRKKGITAADLVMFYGKDPQVSSSIRYAVSYIDRTLNRATVEVAREEKGQ